MANSLQIIDLPSEGRVQVVLLEETGGQTSAAPAPFSIPLSESENAEIDWYFSGYLDNPYGEAAARAQAVERGFQDIGRLLYEGVFGANSEALALLQQSTAEGPGRLALVSSRPEFLALPWELMAAEPGEFLLAKLPEVSRRSQSGPQDTFQHSLPTDQLNVLILCPSLPVGNTGGNTGGPAGSLAAEALAAMESLDIEVGLTCVRPASIQALEDRLAQQPGYYHLVHIDAVNVAADGLAFERADGGPERVSRKRLGEVLNSANVPTALISCAAGSVPGNVAAAIAGTGVAGVAVVPAPLTGPAREQFVQAFYATVAKGANAAQAVAAARKALSDNPHRPSGAGPLVSWDWVTPTAHQSMECALPAIQPQESDTPIPGMQPAQTEPEPHQLPRGGPYGLIGRRQELLNLEHRLSESSVVLLTGDAGVGKSELALGLASWLQRTGGRPGGVFYSSFDVGAGLEKVLHETGTALAGLDFGDFRTPDRRRWLLDYLNEHETLLVWDRVENLSGYPAGTPGLLEDSELADLDGFLVDVAQGGKSNVLLVSRHPEESWISATHAVETLAGLGIHDRIEFANRLLTEGGVEQGRLGPEFLDLLELIGGHPLAMEIAIPLLKEIPASVLVRELESGLENYQPGADEDGRPTYLTVLMENSFGRMSRRSRTHLPFLYMFRNRVMMDILTHITQEAPYKGFMGEQLGWGACRTMLRQTQASGLLEPVTPSVFQVHPALPWFYGRALYRQFSRPAIAQMEAEFVRVYADTADYFMETLYENQASGTTAILAEEGNLTQALALALEAGQWDNAQLLVQPIAQVFRMQKRYPELRRLRRQLLEAVGETGAEAEAKGASELWLYLLGTEAGECVETGELERADEMNQQLLAHLTSRDDGDQDPRTAAVYHQMGQVAQKRWQLDLADEMFNKSLAIIEHREGDDEDRAPVADDYHGLGLVRQYQRRYTEAKEYFSKALDIHQRLEDVEEMVKDYRALGLCAQFKFEYQEAESWYNRAREILEEARDEETAVLVYHSLGTLCHAQYQFDEAENWYQQALTVSDRNGNEAQMAVEFHHLGLLTQAREMFPGDAEHWYTMALEKYEKLGDWRGAGDECRQLGVLFHEQKKLDEAEGWYNRAREIFEEVQDLNRITRTYGQLGMLAEERNDLPEALKWAGQTYQVAAQHDLPVLVQVKAHLARLRDKFGEDNFADWWREFAGEEPPTDLDIDPETIL